MVSVDVKHHVYLLCSHLLIGYTITYAMVPIHSVGTHLGNQLKSPVTMSRVACFILWAHTGTNYRVWKQWMPIHWEIKTSKKFLAVEEACVAILWPTPGFKGRTFVSSAFSTEATSISASAVLHCGDSKRKWRTYFLSFVTVTAASCFWCTSRQKRC